MPKTVWVGGVPTLRPPKDYYPPVYEKEVTVEISATVHTSLVNISRLSDLDKDLLKRVKVTANFVAKKLIRVLEEHHLTTLELANKYAVERYEVARRLEDMRNLMLRYRLLDGSLEATLTLGECVFCGSEAGFVSSYGEMCGRYICESCKEELHRHVN